jgi:hypothetical protein
VTERRYAIIVQTAVALALVAVLAFTLGGQLDRAAKSLDAPPETTVVAP